MSKKIKKIALFLLVYTLIFWLGFRAGEVYNRMKRKTEVETIKIVEEIPPTYEAYYIVEKVNYGTYSHVLYYQQHENDVIIKILKNEKLKHLLKLRDLMIFNPDGERLY